MVSCNYFSLLAPPLPSGADSSPRNAARTAPPLSWYSATASGRSQYASDPQILGKTIVLNRSNFTVVGVAPEGFVGASILGADVWAPFSVQEQWKPGPELLPGRQHELA